MTGLSQRLIKVRAESHLTQKEMAELLGVSMAALRGIEDGSRKTYATTLYKVEKGLDDFEKNNPKK